MYIELVIAIALLLFVIYLLTQEYKKHEKVYIEKKYSRNRGYIEALAKLKKSRERTIKKQEKLYKISRQFFKEYLKLSREMTDEEILEVLKQQKKAFFKFLWHLSNARYSKTPLPREQVNALLNEFIFIVKRNKLPLKYAKS